MPNIRTTFGGIGQRRMSHTPGDITGMSINTFVMDKIIAGLTGEMIAPFVVEALTPAYNQLHETWPVITGASRDSAEVVLTEVGPHHARAALQIGGEKLIEDPRNKSKKDYAPFVEFNGTSKTPAGTLLNAMVDNDVEAKQYLRDRCAFLIRQLAGV